MDTTNTGNAAGVEIVHCIKKTGLVPEEADLTQLYQSMEKIADRKMQAHAPGNVLTQDLNLYVSVNGDDKNDGLTEATAKRTIQNAVDATCGYVPSHYTITVHILPGTYDEGPIGIDFTCHYRRLSILGDSPATTRINGQVNVTNNGVLTLADMTINNEENTATVFSYYYATIICSNLALVLKGGIWQVGLYAHIGLIVARGGISISSTARAQAALIAARSGVIRYETTPDLHISGEYSAGVLHAYAAGVITSFTHITGTCTGRKYYVQGNSLVEYSYKESEIPGSVPGIATRGGVFAAYGG